MRFTIVLNLVLFCGNALAQGFVPPHIGAVVVESGGGNLAGFFAGNRWNSRCRNHVGGCVQVIRLANIVNG